MLVVYLYRMYSAKQVDRAIQSIMSSSQYLSEQGKKKNGSEGKSSKMRDVKLENAEKSVVKSEDTLYDIEQTQGVTKYDPHMEKGKVQVEVSEKIVGVVEPKGFWSKFIASQKIGYILARMSMQTAAENGFWVNLIKAQSASRGKNQGKGR
ncbi:MAG: hypothetical protein ACRY3E_05885 [Candidatus Lariskella arthropodorum]